MLYCKQAAGLGQDCLLRLPIKPQKVKSMFFLKVPIPSALLALGDTLCKHKGQLDCGSDDDPRRLRRRKNHSTNYCSRDWLSWRDKCQKGLEEEGFLRRIPRLSAITTLRFIEGPLFVVGTTNGAAPRKSVRVGCATVRAGGSRGEKT